MPAQVLFPDDVAHYNVLALIYAEVDLEMKAKALALCDIPESVGPKRRPRDADTISFLRTL